MSMIRWFSDVGLAETLGRIVEIEQLTPSAVA